MLWSCHGIISHFAKTFDICTSSFLDEGSSGNRKWGTEYGKTSCFIGGKSSLNFSLFCWFLRLIASLTIPEGLSTGPAPDSYHLTYMKVKCKLLFNYLMSVLEGLCFVGCFDYNHGAMKVKKFKWGRKNSVSSEWPKCVASLVIPLSWHCSYLAVFT